MLFDTQEEREALINLMLLARFSDKKLTIAEEETFTTILDKLVWEDVMTSESFVNCNIAEAREAVRSEETIEHFINNNCAVFTTDVAKALVLKKIDNVLQSDGLADGEIALYNKIKATLNMS